MPTPRRPLGDIDGNSRRGKDLTPILRTEMEGARASGASYRNIVETFDIPRSTI